MSDSRTLKGQLLGTFIRRLFPFTMLVKQERVIMLLLMIYHMSY